MLLPTAFATRYACSNNWNYRVCQDGLNQGMGAAVHRSHVQGWRSLTICTVEFDGGPIRCFGQPDIQVFPLPRFKEENAAAALHYNISWLLSRADSAKHGCCTPGEKQCTATCVCQPHRTVAIGMHCRCLMGHETLLSHLHVCNLIYDAPICFCVQL